MSTLISVVVPVYLGEATVSPLVEANRRVLSSITEHFEIILVDDRSPDRSWEEIVSESAKDPRVRGIRLSRNFGQHRAVTAGLAHSKGDYVIIMDCDLQDNPDDIPRILAKAREGNEVVYTLKERRKHGLVKTWLAQFYFLISNSLVEDQTLKGSPLIGAYTLMSRKVVDAFLSLKEYHRHYLALLRTLGFTSGYVEVVHRKRYAGRSSYTFMKLVIHAIDGIVSQSDKVLRYFVTIGFIFSCFSFLYILVLICLYFLRGQQPGYTSLAVLILFSTGVILTSVGVVGIYVGKVFEQVKERPLFVVESLTDIQETPT